ncbi:MAG: FliI/YscN family ATPase [Rickettsiaceae bacterium]
MKDISLLSSQINKINRVKIKGSVTGIKGIVVTCEGIVDFVAIGSLCKIYTNNDNEILSEVIAINESNVLLMPFKGIEGVGYGSIVEVFEHENIIYPDESWMGRVINSLAEPLDDLGPLQLGEKQYHLHHDTMHNPQNKNKVGTKIDLGVKVIDTMISCCYGQRMGIFSGSGVGKSVLISMLTKYAKVDVKVIGLIGERSREVKEFIEEYLGEDGLQNTVIVVTTGNESPALRRRAAYATITIAEYFRDQGNEVLCMLDSITRFAMAQREIGLGAGEPPTTKGYTPSVFSELPKIFERTGPGINGLKDITGLFTVLVEGDDQNEPISDAVRGILDGHIVLDRQIAERGMFPAVNVLRSISRAMPGCNTELENKMIGVARQAMSTYEDMRDMIRLGVYKKGSNSEVDRAIVLNSKLENFFKQSPEQSSSMEQSYKLLQEITGVRDE